MKNLDFSVNPEELLKKVKNLRERVFNNGNELFKKWEAKINKKDFLSSAQNLSYYLALRAIDITDIQDELSLLGLSSLGRLESRTLETIDAVICSLENILSEKIDLDCYPSRDNFWTGREKLEKNSETLFGAFPDNRKNMILVTMHNDLSYNDIEDFMKRGMNLARINCAKENPKIWDSIITNIRKAEKKLNKSCKILADIAGPKVRIKWIMSSLEKNRVKQGHKIFISNTDDAVFDSNYEVQIGCTLPEVLSKVKKGDALLIDDGSIEGKVTEIKENGIVVSVNKVVKDKGVKIKTFKGINFPNSNLELDILTNKDKQDLDYVVENVDIACISFINTSEDIDYTISEIKKRLKDNKENHPVIAKIETPEAINNLPEIIVAGAGNTNFGIMIARGDLAVELGYLRFAEIQQEILWICEAADIPVIWATQVLESMAKTGIPSRAEVTDAAEGGAKSECVMLNKGPYIADVITFLDELLENMKENNYKKSAKLRALNIAKNYFNKN